MLNLKRSGNLRSLRKERRDDLSIVTGLSSFKRRSSFGEYSKAKRVRTDFESDIKLRRQFLEARLEALGKGSTKETTTSNFDANERHRQTIANSSDYSITDSFHKVQDFNVPINFNKPPINVTQHQSEEESGYFASTPTGPLPPPKGSIFRETTIRSVPSLVKASDCKNALRGILKPSYRLNRGQPVISQCRQQSETDYWTSFIRRNDEVHKSSSRTGKVLAMDSSSSKYSPRQGWGACSSFVITRECAPVVQAEVASLASSRSSTSQSHNPSSSGFSSDFGSISTIGGRTPGTPMPSLLNSIKPPTTPAPFTDTDPLAFLKIDQYNETPLVLMGDWMSRENMKSNLPVTKNYSVAQLVDILCGFTNPTDSDLAGHIFQPESSFGQKIIAKENLGNCNEQGAEVTVPDSTPDRRNRKSVSFFTDSQDNVRVKEHYFNGTSQASGDFFLSNPTVLGSTSTNILDVQMGKENEDSTFNEQFSSTFPEFQSNYFNNVGPKSSTQGNNPLSPFFCASHSSSAQEGERNKNPDFDFSVPLLPSRSPLQLDFSNNESSVLLNLGKSTSTTKPHSSVTSDAFAWNFQNPIIDWSHDLNKPSTNGSGLENSFNANKKTTEETFELDLQTPSFDLFAGN